MAINDDPIIDRDTPILTVGDISRFFMNTVHANGLSGKLRTGVTKSEARSAALGALEQLSTNVKAASERAFEQDQKFGELQRDIAGVRRLFGLAPEE